MKKKIVWLVVSCVIVAAVLLVSCAPAVTPTPRSAQPSAPVNLEANAVSQDTVDIRWLDNSNNEDGFRVYRGTTLVGTVGANSARFQDTGLKPGTTYQYAVKAYNQAGESQAALCTVTTPAPPVAATNLTPSMVSHSEVHLMWEDNSNNEDGFGIYRDDSLIANVGINVNAYNDIGLQPATHYQYTVIAYNQIGESQPCNTTVKTLNPPIMIRLDRIGVYDNGEHWLRGEDGEVYAYIVISDGKKTTERVRFPQQQGQHYKLAKNETVDIGAVVFSTDEVGDSLTLTIIGYEDDGGAFEQLVYEALGLAIESQTAGGAGLLLEAFGFSLGGIVAQFFGTEDDWLGSYENAWGSDSNWGIGTYIDIACEEEDGTLGLRLWFTIESPR